MSGHPLHGVKPQVTKARLACDWGELTTLTLWKCRFRTPGDRSWRVVRGTKSEVDSAAARLRAEGKEVDISRL